MPATHPIGRSKSSHDAKDQSKTTCGL